eukprot:CAMPEP_0206488308 /NCGR_PEP_ID=MMETSP0324_2-20121206/42308_1 /ASSEMBLY_ACC=CAM_ASM_000836 /TAXON_ID=2866 /ORGANISM="Crypthecodinium cohnii, Strain Seligo" /LENGTH=44 /DNA_ID= /DNA_START= /DNA_END= /DNA_ORIENTATION=
MWHAPLGGLGRPIDLRRPREVDALLRLFDKMAICTSHSQYEKCN